MKHNMLQYKQYRNHKLIKSTSRISKTSVVTVIQKAETGAIILLFLKNAVFSYPTLY